MKNTNERKSIIRGFMANPYTKTFDEFEIETAYTRSLTKAVEFAREELALDKDVMLSVTEIINEPVKAVEYDAQSLCDFATAIDNHDDFEPTETQTVIPFTAYIYSGQIWAVSGEDYTTEHYEVERNIKLTKVDQRVAVAMAYEKEWENWHVLGVHEVKREAVERFALIEREALANVKTK